jgi:hypothetical protein
MKMTDWINHIRSCTTAMSMNQLNLFVTQQLYDLALNLHVKSFQRINDMATDAHCLQTTNHLARGKRQAHRLKLLLIQERYQIQQVRLSPTNLSLSNNF